VGEIAALAPQAGQATAQRAGEVEAGAAGVHPAKEWPAGYSYFQ